MNNKLKDKIEKILNYISLVVFIFIIYNGTLTFPDIQNEILAMLGLLFVQIAIIRLKVE